MVFVLSTFASIPWYVGGVVLVQRFVFAGGLNCDWNCLFLFVFFYWFLLHSYLPLCFNKNSCLLNAFYTIVLDYWRFVRFSFVLFYNMGAHLIYYTIYYLRYEYASEKLLALRLCLYLSKFYMILSQFF